ncbi:MAG TPA: site-2 protease family protein [Bacillota bacterium]|nr:site-2 protease family protein [Bacillota bacterium]
MNMVILIIYLFVFVSPISTLIHEGGHALGAKLVQADRIDLTIGNGKEKCSIRLKNIVIILRTNFFFGGLTESERKQPYKPWEMACITVCGPLMNSLFALLFYILYTIYTSEYILVFSLLNGWMALANFVPYKINNKKSDGYVFFNILFNQLFKSGS